MNARRLRPNLTLAAVAAATFWAATTLPTLADARSMPLATAQPVNVQIGFSTQVPLADESEQTLINSQQSGRKALYEMASKECSSLMATIAKTCRLTSLNISAQVRQRGNMPAVLFLNCNAHFAITLKDDGAN
jgi:hypothetical protein